MKDSIGAAGTVFTAYEHRVEVFGRVMREVERVLKDSRAEQETLISELRERLAKTRSLRRKDFDTMMAGTGLSEGDHSIGQAALELEKEGRTLCGMLKRACRTPAAAGVSRLKALSDEILSGLDALEREAIRRLKRMQLRQEELRGALDKLVRKGEGIRIQDLRRVAQGLRLLQEMGRSEPGALLDDLEIARREASYRWAEALKERISADRRECNGKVLRGVG